MSDKTTVREAIPEITGPIWSSAVHSRLTAKTFPFANFSVSVHETFRRPPFELTCAEENVASGGMPGHDADPLRVAL